MSRLKSWWGQKDQFDWVTTFLRQRGLIRSAQVMLAIICLSAAWVPVTVWATQKQPSFAHAIICGVTVVFSLGAAAFWLTHWPTRWQSRLVAVTGMLSTAGWSLVQPNPEFGALACTSLGVTGGYIALFHGPKLLTLNSVVAAVSTVTVVVRIAREVDVASGAAAFWLIWFPNFSIPVIIWGVSQAMGTYIERAERDPLTGLYNRLAFAEAVNTRLSNHAPADTHLAVMMMDLDDFKRVNDTQGHSAGDRLLQTVAALLREHTPSGAIICRAGGEEFLIALTCTVEELAPVASQICTAIAGIPTGVTASIGTTCADLTMLSAGEGEELIAKLIALADDAMYAAKRRGGNQAHHWTAR